MVNGKFRRAHQLVLELSGQPKPHPDAVVDHIDVDPSNNTLSNLRWITQSKNAARPTKHRNKSGYRGVYKIPKSWQYQFLMDRELHVKSGFKTAFEAHCSRLAHRLELNWI